MTRHLNHIISAGKRLRVKLNAQPVRDYTVPSGRLLRIRGTEHRIVPAGTRIEVLVDGNARLDYTVPDGHVLIIDYEERDDPG
jgi:hypothetical protein